MKDPLNPEVNEIEPETEEISAPFDDDAATSAGPEELEESFLDEEITFESLGMDERLLKTVAELGWSEPTPVQKMCLPATLRKRNLAGFAQTGTGKTGVFLLTIGQRFLTERTEQPEGPAGPFAVVISPTRELAMQIAHEAEKILDPIGIKSLAVFGGADWEKQSKTLGKGVDVIVATPGRFRDFYSKNKISLAACEVFVCDEADRMFDMGFIKDVEFFLEHLPEESQKLLFSATTSDDVKELVFQYVDSPEYISVNPESITPEAIEQHAIICEARNKLKVLLGLLKDTKPERALIFTNTKLSAEWLHYKLANNGVPADVITGDLPQKKRIKLIHRIKEGDVKVLIATDVASRGLHISGVTHVYNFDLPDEPANYVHRIGRTARGGATGSSYTLVCDDYGHNLIPINELLGDAAPQPVWHDEAYLQIEDKAGNPFKDKERRERRGPRPEAEERSKTKTADKRRRPSEEDAMRPDKAKRKQRGKKPYRDGDAGPALPADRQSTRPDRHSKKPRRQRKPRGPREAAAQAPMQKPQPTQQPPKSVGGLLKKIFKTFFGRK